MNKSLDDRILPEGEYRDALNVQVTKNGEEGANVGVIHNIKGNTILNNTLGLSSSYQVIGTFFDDKNNDIYWFVTNGSTSHRVYKYNTSTDTLTWLLKGTFLNFSKDIKHRITGINLIEDLLFWTDNKNQPRRINVSKAVGNPATDSSFGYYDSEHKISVAKYAPYEAPVAAIGYDSSIQSNLLEEEFARFAYRYKYADNEYSLISPFSQIAFEMGSGATASNTISEADEAKIFKLTENHKVINRGNKVDLTIPLPSSTPVTDYEIVSIDILYKESDSSAVRVIETIDVTDSIGSSYSYTYKSTPPKSTLPEDQVVRAAENVPIRAKAQEISSNRVIYGNFTQDYDLPSVNYNVYCTQKNTANYPHHSVKQRRTYEVGIVFMDKYGRTSPVVLSPTSKITVEAKPEDFLSSTWLGDSFKIAFSGNIEGKHVIGDPSFDTSLGNDLGWYSYKIVVKQYQQEYYNVYNPGISKGYITLHNDNINKVPRDTNNSIDNDGLFPSNSRLYPKIVNYNDPETTINAGIEQKLSSEGLYKIESIGTARDFGLYNDDTVGLVQGFYEQEKFYLLGRLEDGIDGNELNYIFPGVLSVFETEPFESSLDIFYETSTSGLISYINGLTDTAISNILIEPSNNGSGTESDIEFSEALTSGNYIARLRAVDASGNDIPYATFALDNNDTLFGIEKDSLDGYYKIKTIDVFAFDADVQSNNEYILSVTASADGSSDLQITDIAVAVTNAPPTLESFNNKTIAKSYDSSVSGAVYTLQATNGSADSANNKGGLTVSHEEIHDNVAHTVQIFTSSIDANGVVTIGTDGAVSASHDGEYITIDITVTNGSASVTKSGVVYISTISEGLNSYLLSYESNETQYSTTSAACSAYSSFPLLPTVYSDTDPSTGSQIYKDVNGTALAPAGWYGNGSWSGKWKVVPTSTGFNGYWEIGPSNCTT